MPKIVFNNIPKKLKPFPFEVYDNEIDLSALKLSFRIYHDDYERSASLGIDVKGSHVHIADIKLYHSDKLFNFEDTFESAEILLMEIVKRFNSFVPKGQQCLEFS
ncbi:hypothetical protein SJPD1_1063 [Sulfurospirillum diekertiae]|uniref:Uncharacterized protein n=1 Tax=Sulfurospirillum diekertiae TaxID=1854492 RepID=A0A290HMC7_9BACT|nr:hypothetical protein [Sulfurospirillum diekertiae]ATB68868.1 hypothetical protein SJPD1_0754 [Sulfurospirillum diekertiae]ATB69175.1 hypothetical protein SJPD1_1063 [Sulfurospirillum diekertiae]